MALSKTDKLKKLATLSSPEGNGSKWGQIARWNRDHKHALDDYVVIANRILRYLKANGITQSELANKLGVSPQALTRIVKGRQNLSLNTIRKIERALNISLISIIQESESTVEVSASQSLLLETSNTSSIIRQFKIEDHYLNDFSSDLELKLA